MTDVIDLLCSAYVVTRSGGRSNAYWGSSRSERHGVGQDVEEKKWASTNVCL